MWFIICLLLLSCFVSFDFEMHLDILLRGLVTDERCALYVHETGIVQLHVHTIFCSED
jgi:hypothetical protein